MRLFGRRHIVSDGGERKSVVCKTEREKRPQCQQVGVQLCADVMTEVSKCEQARGVGDDLRLGSSTKLMTAFSLS